MELVKLLYSNNSENLVNHPLIILILPVFSFLYAFVPKEQENMMLAIIAPITFLAADMGLDVKNYILKSRDKLKILYPSMRTPPAIIKIKDAIQKKSMESIKEMMKL